MAELGDLLTLAGTGKEKEVTVDMLDYKYVDQCTDVDLLRGIVAMLKSGREGHFPHLVAHAEERLMSLIPAQERTRILRVRAEPDASVVLEAQTELQQWENSISRLDKSIRDGVETEVAPTRASKGIQEVGEDAALGDGSSKDIFGENGSGSKAGAAARPSSKRRLPPVRKVGSPGEPAAGAGTGSAAPAEAKKAAAANTDDGGIEEVKGSAATEAAAARSAAGAAAAGAGSGGSGGQKPAGSRISGYDFRAWEKYDPEDVIREVEKEEQLHDEKIRLQTGTGAKRAGIDEAAASRRATLEELRLAALRERLAADEMTPLQRQQAAEREKVKGNEAYRAGDCQEAFDCYSRSLALDGKAAATYCNRAAAALKLGRLEVAEEDSTRCVELDPSYAKGWNRRAMARHRRGKYAAAVADFDRAMALAPPESRKELEALREKSLRKHREVEGERAGIKEVSSSHKTTSGPASSQSEEATATPVPLGAPKGAEGDAVAPAAAAATNEGRDVPIVVKPHPPLPPGVQEVDVSVFGENAAAAAVSARSPARISRKSDELPAPPAGFTRVRIQEPSDSDAEGEEEAAVASDAAATTAAAATVAAAASASSVPPPPPPGFRRIPIVEEEDDGDDEKDGSAARDPLDELDRRTESDKLKLRGNEAMGGRKYKEAIDWYTKALRVDGANVAALNNRAQAWLELKRWSKAEADATEALRLDPNNGKALIRRASARRWMGAEDPERLPDARADLHRLLAMEPGNAKAIDELRAVEILVADEMAREHGGERHHRRVSFSDGSQPGDNVEGDDEKIEEDRRLEAEHLEVARDHWPKEPIVQFADASKPGDEVEGDDEKVDGDRQLEASKPEAKTVWPTTLRGQPVVQFSDGTVPGAVVPDDEVRLESDKVLQTRHAQTAATPWVQPSASGIQFADGTAPGDVVPRDAAQQEADRALQAKDASVAATPWPAASPGHRHTNSIQFEDGTTPGDVVPEDAAKLEADRRLQEAHADVAKTPWAPHHSHSGSIQFADGTVPGDVVPEDEAKLEADRRLQAEHAEAQTHWPGSPSHKQPPPPPPQQKVGGAIGEDARRASEAAKEKGNAAVKKGAWAAALTAYDRALELNPDNTACRNNRAMVRNRVKDFGGCVSDASVVLEAEPRNVKALFRRAQAERALGKTQQATADLDRLLAIDPSNKEALAERAKLPRSVAPSASSPAAQPGIQAIPASAGAASGVTPIVPAIAKAASTSPAQKAPAKAPAKPPPPAAAAAGAAVAAAAARAASLPELQPQVPTTPPTTAYELERVWRNIKSRSESLSVYMRTFTPATFKKVFRQAADADLVSSLLTALRDHTARDDPAEAARFLRGLAKSEGFRMTAMVMSDDDRAAVRATLDEVAAAGVKVAALETQYGV